MADEPTSHTRVQGIGEQLAAAGTGGEEHLHIEGNTFHGVPDQRYVSSIIERGGAGRA
jgi:hypothetical protein